MNAEYSDTYWTCETSLVKHDVIVSLGSSAILTSVGAVLSQFHMSMSFLINLMFLRRACNSLTIDSY